MTDRTRHKMMIAMTKEHWRSIDPQWKDDPELCHALGYEAGYNNAGIVSEGMIQARMQDEIDELRAAIEQTHDWDEVEALRASLREHMAEIHRLRQWQGLTDNEIALICGECAASAHQTDDLSYARAIEARLREKNS